MLQLTLLTRMGLSCLKPKSSDKNMAHFLLRSAASALLCFNTCTFAQLDDNALCGDMSQIQDSLLGVQQICCIDGPAQCVSQFPGPDLFIIKKKVAQSGAECLFVPRSKRRLLEGLSGCGGAILGILWKRPETWRDGNVNRLGRILFGMQIEST